MTPTAVDGWGMTPTDVDGWVRAAPILLILALALLGLTAVLERTPVGRRVADRLIDWIVR